jgi:hypothetical protein
LNVFLEQWIRQGGPTVWPGPSHDLNHLDFYRWGHPKSIVYVPEVSDVQELQQQIQNGDDFYNTSKSGNHCSDVKCHVLKLKLYTEHFL